MDIKPTQEQIKAFQNNIVWKVVETWLNEQKERVKGASLNANTLEELKGLQGQHKAYEAVLVKVKRMANEKAE